MSTQALRESVLAQQRSAVPQLDQMNADDLKRAARFWFGTTVSNKLRKAECADALAKAFHDRTRLEAGLRSLPDKERQLLAVFKTYGGALSGPLLQSEALARGLIQPIDKRDLYRSRDRTDDPIQDLCAKLLLVTAHGSGYSRYGYSYYSSYRRSYPDLSLLPGVRDLIEPVAPLPWKPSAPASSPGDSFQRSAAEVALDLWSLAQALAQAAPWKTNRGGSLAKSVQNRLHKLMPGDAQDPLQPPVPESLYYEILRGLGAIDVEGDSGLIDLKVVEQQLRQPAAVQAWHWVRAWLSSRLWQDGIGVVPDRDSYEHFVRIEPRSLRSARELLVWALCRVAHGPEDWLDLETFLIDLGSALDEDTIQFYGSGYTWQPNFASSRGKEKLTVEAGRRRAYWLENEGAWAANALLGTLAFLGLLERGGTGTSRGQRPGFRLTPLGQAVFGAPDRDPQETADDPRFLTVQPNHEVLAYLDVADASAVWPLAQMARRTSTGGGRVQTFALTRDSVYQGLESGLTLEAIEQFLRTHSRTGLPANVAHSLAEWGRRREALVLRSGVCLGVAPPGETSVLPTSPRARAVGDGFVLLPRSAVRQFKAGPVVDHLAPPRPTWRVDDEGRLRGADEADAVALARLSQFAEPSADGWQITAASVRKAHDRGIPAEQILGWLQDHLSKDLPPIMETAIRNWSNPARVFLDTLLMLQVPQPQACAMIQASPRFRPFLLGQVPPDWFLVRPDRRAELEQLLADLGFALGASYRLSVPAEEGSTGAAPHAPAPGRRGRKRKRVDPLE